MTHPSLTFSPDSLTHLQSSFPLSVSPPLSTPFKASISTPNSRQFLHWRDIFFTGTSSQHLLHWSGSFFIGTSSRHLLHWRGIFFTGTSSRQLFHRTIKLSLLSLGVCLSSRGGSRSGETSPDLVRSHQI